ncbi:hypothetical protein [Asticcacaulis solisilvae]|uniref:hypothetical protein n=1 Tax=Asticcacaulis solisilvae TaxID=1217274 RepID=UPI003FD7513C
MGVDAQIFIRHAGQHLTEKQVHFLAGDLCALIGPENFHFHRKPQNGEAPRHALSIVTDTVATVRAEAAEYGESADDLIGHPDDAPVWQQDGPPVIGAPQEQFIRVHLWSRYYGPGYERGNWPTIRALVEFLESAVAGCQVWYGGDSSGINAQHFNAARREAFNRHFLAQGHTPYYTSFDRVFSKETLLCDFCGDRPMNATGLIKGASIHRCYGCELTMIITGDGKRHEIPKDADMMNWQDYVK